MKNAAIVYYTTDRLPKNVGDSKKMTLREMISQKLISPLVDKNNKPVDVDASYVQITKTNDGFKISEEDFILRGSGDLFGLRQSGDMVFKIANIKAK